MQFDRPLVVFDGMCVLCSRVVRFVIRHDRDGNIAFLPLQTPLGQRLLEKHGIDPIDAETFLFIDGDAAYVRSDAALEIARRAVAEMLRVLRPGGFFISLNPYAGCILHTLGKSFVESVTTYPYGEEIPLHTLESGAKHAGQQLYGEEFSVGFIVLFVGMFKRLMIVPGMGWFAPVYRLSDRFFYSLYKYDKVARFMRKADRALARLLGGYLLATVIQKQDRPAGRPGE